MKSTVMNRLFAAAILALTTITTNAQIDGDNLFGPDQVVTIELTFSQTNYWDSLIYYYDYGTYMAADLTITDVVGTYTFNDVGVRFKGNSTYNHPNNKKPLKIDFNKYVSGQNYDGLKKLNLNNCFKDPSMMREKIFFDMCQDAGVLAPRANFANVYINGSLMGFYSLVEQIDDQFLDWAIGDDDGNLFKAGDNFGGGPGGGTTPADLVYYGGNQTAYADRYELKTNEIANDWSDLVHLIDVINNTASVDFDEAFYYNFEGQELLRSLAIDNLYSNLDSYIGSARNYYLYHNYSTGKWEWVKWDANETFGSYANGQDVLNLSITYSESSRPLMDQIFNNEYLLMQYKNEMCYVLENFFNSSYLDPKIDSYYNLIKDHVYADGNKMYTDANFDDIINSDITASGGPGGSSTIYGLKPFIAYRNSYAQTQVDCNVYTGLEEVLMNELKVYPNPANNYIEVSLGDDYAKVNYQLVDLSGKVIVSNSISNKDSFRIDSWEYPSGSYILMVSIDDIVLRKKVIIQH